VFDRLGELAKEHADLERMFFQLTQGQYAGAPGMAPQGPPPGYPPQPQYQGPPPPSREAPQATTAPQPVPRFPGFTGPDGQWNQWDMDPRWFAPHMAYTMSKYGMSMIVLGLSEELKQFRIAANALWPRTIIATAAVQNVLGGDFLMQRSRTVDIVADAAYYILQKPSFETTGNFFIDEDVLKTEGITEFGQYAINPDQKLMNDLFL